ncbi:hypothetical protein Cgig2_022504 [Carnegiea gigantea]|uniref:SHSP domain-containing protein n=1 Tax=Carnegiea gigantea TaxID=171969 RepID=A0A9Q1KAM1_9CARY|nr:hypothetical protein Cgig2_022504 [Carnegiea gigantea]
MAVSNLNHQHEDFDPPSDWISEEACDTLLLYLPGFRKEQLRVQLTPSRILKITGERPIGENKWRRFQKQVPVPSNCDTREISAQFEGGILYIRQPKIITPAIPAQEQPEDKGKAAQEVPKPQPQPYQPERDQVPPGSYEENKSEKKEDTMARNDETNQAPTREPQMQQEAPPSELPNHENEKKKGERTEGEEVKGGDELIERRPGQVVRGSGFFRELRRPENMKRLVVSVVMVLAVGFYISYMFRSFTGNEQEKMPGSDQREL